MFMEEKVVLVNEKDEILGLMEKMQAHENGILHRAFSVFLFNSKGEMLLQKRAAEKYHSPNQWTNACCSHPRDGETTQEATHRRLIFEMGIDAPLTHVYEMAYEAHFDNGVIENEYDHVYLGRYDENPVPNADEVNDYRWISLDDLKFEMETEPEKYTFWFKKIIKEFDFAATLSKS